MKLISYTDQYEVSGRRGSQPCTVAPRDHISIGGPPSVIQLRLGTSEYCGTNHVSLSERTAVGIKLIHIATIAQRNSAETSCFITIVDKEIDQS